MDEHPYPCWDCGYPGPHRWAPATDDFTFSEESQWLWRPGLCGRCHRVLRVLPMIDAVAVEVRQS